MKIHPTEADLFHLDEYNKAKPLFDILQTHPKIIRGCTCPVRNIQLLQMFLTTVCPLDLLHPVTRELLTTDRMEQKGKYCYHREKYTVWNYLTISLCYFCSKHFSTWSFLALQEPIDTCNIQTWKVMIWEIAMFTSQKICTAPVQICHTHINMRCLSHFHFWIIWQIFVITGMGGFSASYLCSCLNIREQVSHSYQTKGKITEVNNLISLPLENKQQYKKKFWAKC
jgi:hypothetical protein